MARIFIDTNNQGYWRSCAMIEFASVKPYPWCKMSVDAVSTRLPMNAMISKGFM